MRIASASVHFNWPNQDNMHADVKVCNSDMHNVISNVHRNSDHAALKQLEPYVYAYELKRYLHELRN